jgi:hypothetical protein
MRHGLLLLIAAVWIAGCGSVRDIAARPTATPGCPQGEPFVRAVDVIGRPVPEGYVIDPGDKTALRRFATQFRDRIGDEWRGYDAKVLLPEGKLNGTAVVVLNAKAQTGGSDELVAGIERGARERGQSAEPIQIAGREGRLVQALDGAYIAMAPARKCAIVMLVADKRPLVTNAARVIPEE